MRTKKPGLILAGLLLTSQIFADNVASVNGVNISQANVDILINLSQANGRPLAPANALEALIQNEVMLQKAHELKIGERPKVKKQIEEVSKQVIVSNMVDDIVTKIEITDAEYQKYYDEMKDTLASKQYNAKHILLKDEKTAKEVIAKLDAGGDFAKLAAEHSIGPTGKTGGELNWFNLNAMDPGFSNGLKKLEKGKYSKEPVKSQFGYHVIFFNDIKEVPAPALADIKPQVKNIILSNKFAEHIKQLVAKAKIEKVEKKIEDMSKANEK